MDGGMTEIPEDLFSPEQLALAEEKIKLWNEKKFSEDRQFFRQLDAAEAEEAIALRSGRKSLASLHKVIEDGNYRDFLEWIIESDEDFLGTQEYIDPEVLLDMSSEGLRKYLH